MDSEYIEILWERAVAALGTARLIEKSDSDGAANRAYYAAFHAVSALFALEEMYYKKHSGVQSAVHKELIHTGRWPKELGSDFDNLLRFRGVADYGAKERATPEMTTSAISAAQRVLSAVHKENPQAFPLDITRNETAD